MSRDTDLQAAPASSVREVFEPNVALFGLNIAAVPFETAVEVLTQTAMLRDGRSRIVVTPNVDHIVRLDTQPEFKREYRNADFLFADGMPIIWASRLFGKPLPGRVTGADLLPALCDNARASGRKAVFVGGRPGQEAQLTEGLSRRFPGLDFTLLIPSMTFDPTGPEGQDIAQRVRALAPDLIFVCLGMPKQERWAMAYADTMPGGLMLCVGAAIEFAAGMQKRAPKWMQRTGSEWMYRILQNPGRMWRRYLVDDRRFIGICWRQWRELGRE
ncbi:WecB/TagA/CpsF family glycosyltransferase [Pandoraea sputorum]|uniref:Putative N-acetylmannosaminyltransferase n=1 Tax=Pandoraea sputorum TaxID=93222 RepID=A0A239SV52_9BURK|nr:WecB/TagA/CpsF family glycosyltransferase [Pandoraea sputorum]BET12041.1 WecB/TagA/CpsF family glycosyltransferase [Pandoraea sputorum]SNU89385.1 Putative N-acetylmannosaminyltransferase [Pandoraea sputorum]VVE18968.1 capsular biosynthesis protein [Pandoraea sputorum]